MYRIVREFSLQADTGSAQTAVSPLSRLRVSQVTGAVIEEQRGLRRGEHGGQERDPCFSGYRVALVYESFPELIAPDRIRLAFSARSRCTTAWC